MSLFEPRQPRTRDGFDRLCVDPDDLPMAERVSCLSELATELLASEATDARWREKHWLGRSLNRWLVTGGELERILSVRPPRGSRVTPQALQLRERQSQVLLKLATAFKDQGDAAALRVLRGAEPCPAEHFELVNEARVLQCPTSKDAITRARNTSSRHRR